MAVPERLLPHRGKRTARRRGEPVDRLPLRRPRPARQPGRDREVGPSLRPRPGARRLRRTPKGRPTTTAQTSSARRVGYAHNATYWRVDWNTLANADVPIAEWTFSTESATPAAGETWPANAGVHSAGIQYALVVSAQHARLLDVATGAPVAGRRTAHRSGPRRALVRGADPDHRAARERELAGAAGGRAVQRGGDGIRNRPAPGRGPARRHERLQRHLPQLPAGERAGVPDRAAARPRPVGGADRRAGRRRGRRRDRTHPRGRVREHVDGERPGQHARHRATCPSTRWPSTGPS